MKTFATRSNSISTSSSLSSSQRQPQSAPVPFNNNPSLLHGWGTGSRVSSRSSSIRRSSSSSCMNRLSVACLHRSESSSQPQWFRESVAAIIFNGMGRILCGKRLDLPYWQFPQGGIQPSEDLVTAASREVLEELGVPPTSLQPLHTRYQPNETFTYHHPVYKDGKHYGGQEQRYVLFHWDGDLSQCSLHGTPQDPPEFSEVAWLSWDELVKRAVPSRMFIYARLRNSVPNIVKDYLRHKQQQQRQQQQRLLKRSLTTTTTTTTTTPHHTKSTTATSTTTRDPVITTISTTSSSTTTPVGWSGGREMDFRNFPEKWIFGEMPVQQQQHSYDYPSLYR